MTANLYQIHNEEALSWLAAQRANTFHAVVTDPPFGNLEYTPKELANRRNGKGVWRLPQAFDGAQRQPMPRFTTLSDHDRMQVLAFNLQLAPALHRVLVPGAHVFIACQVLVAHLIAQAFTTAGFESRGQIVRVVKTLRGGDRPKFGDKEFSEVSVIPRSHHEPWLLFRKPCDGTVVENLRKHKTGALRRPSKGSPFSDVIIAAPARKAERLLADHPSLKPQALMRQLVRASLPLGKGVVLDPFMGSGSTLAAATHLGLRSVGVERDIGYYKLAQKGIPKLAKFEVALPRDGQANPPE